MVSISQVTQKQTRIPRHERLHICMCLAFVGGYLDIYTYLVRGEVFANTQTGNMVLMSVALTKGEWMRAAYYLAPLLAFALGVLVTEGIRQHEALSWQCRVLMIEVAILTIVGFCSLNVPHIVVNTMISFVCSMQVNSFRFVIGAPYASTMITGTLRSASEQFFAFWKEKTLASGVKFARYLSIILCFGVGAAGGGVLTQMLGARSVWCCAVLLLLVAFVLYRDAKHQKIF